MHTGEPSNLKTWSVHDVIGEACHCAYCWWPPLPSNLVTVTIKTFKIIYKIKHLQPKLKPILRQYSTCKSIVEYIILAPVVCDVRHLHQSQYFMRLKAFNFCNASRFPIRMKKIDLQIHPAILILILICVVNVSFKHTLLTVYGYFHLEYNWFFVLTFYNMQSWNLSQSL